MEDKPRKTLVVNLLGAPGAGKTTLASLLFAKLKLRGVLCEMATEFAKEIVWENRLQALRNQLYIFSEQFYRIWRIKGLVDVVITDSPILLSIYYNRGQQPDYRMPDESFTQLILDCHRHLPSLNFFVVRDHKYENQGRLSSCEQSDEMSKSMEELFKEHKIKLKKVTSGFESADTIAEMICKEIKRLQGKRK